MLSAATSIILKVRVSKTIATEKEFCALNLSKMNSVNVRQQHFRTRFRKSLSTKLSIYDWYKKCEITLCHGIPLESEKQLEYVHVSCF